MSDRFDVEYLEIGDSFEGGAIEQSYFISAVMAAGGEVDIYGDTVFIVNLPKKEVIEDKAPVVEEPVIEEPIIVKSEPEDAPLVDLASEEAVVEAPKAATSEPKMAAKPGPKPKTESTPEADKE